MSYRPRIIAPILISGTRRYIFAANYTNKMAIEQLIFDLGGVIINIDYNLTALAFKQLGINDFDTIYSKAKQDNLFDEFEKGTISNAGLRNRLKEHLPDGTSDEQIDAAWNSMLIAIPSHRVEWLQKLRKHYRIFLLSNTNRIHIKAFTAITDQQFGKGVFESTFEQHYYSCDIGMRKPDAEIFEKVLNDNQLDRAKTLFIDDSIQHIEGASKINLPAEWLQLDKGETIEVKYASLLK